MLKHERHGQHERRGESSDDCRERLQPPEPLCQDHDSRDAKVDRHQCPRRDVAEEADAERHPREKSIEGECRCR